MRDDAANELGSFDRGATEEVPVFSEPDVSGKEESPDIPNSNSEDNSEDNDEESAGGLFRGDKDKKKKGGLKASGKKKAVISTIIGIVFGAGAVFTFSFGFQLDGIVSAFRIALNGMQYSAASRSNSLLPYQMGSKAFAKNDVGIFKDGKFNLSKTQIKKFSAQGIEYDESFKDTNISVLKYKDDSGDIRIVVASEDDAKVLSRLDLPGFSNADGVKYSTDIKTFGAMIDDPSFSSKYTGATKTWRGAISGWFGNITNKYLKINNNSRNAYKNFGADGDNDGENSTAKGIDDVIDNMKARTGDDISDANVKSSTLKEEGTDNDGNSKYGVGESVESKGESFSRVGLSDTEVKSRLKSLAKKYGDDEGGGFSEAAQKVSNYTCLAMSVMGGASLLATGAMLVQVYTIVSSFFEAVDKVKAGDGDASPYNVWGALLNLPKTSTYSVLSLVGDKIPVGDTVDDDKISEDGVKDVVTKEVSESGTGTQAEGLVAYVMNRGINAKDPSVQSFNLASTFGVLLGGIGVSMDAFKNCSVAKIAANAWGAVESLFDAGTCVATSGVSCLITFAKKLGIGIASGVGMSVVISGLISTITPALTKMLSRDLISNIGGLDLGNALAFGAAFYLLGVFRSNGGSLTNRKQYAEFKLVQQDIIAENAEYERATRSPFDITSSYTFMGTLANKMMGFMGGSSIMSTVTSMGSMLSSSLMALTPTASAYDVASDLMTEEEYEKQCPYLASIGAVGDVFCNPYIVTDTSTLSMDPSEVVYQIKDNFKDGVEGDSLEIKPDSDLAKYILFCNNRSSSFGIVDQNIVNEVSDFATANTGNQSFDSKFNSAVGGIPFVGDAIDVINNAKAYVNAGYISGESCVAGNNVSVSTTGYLGTGIIDDVISDKAPDWNTAKYYQRFIEDQSLMESMGIGDSVVSAFLDDYYEKNPIDNSYEGVLARYSGMTKENVVAVLDIVDYYNYIAEYDATERYAFGAPAVEMDNVLLFDNNNVLAGGEYIILMNNIVLADVRNRSFVV